MQYQNHGKHTVLPVSALPNAHVKNILEGDYFEFNMHSKAPFQAMHFNGTGHITWKWSNSSNL